MEFFATCGMGLEPILGDELHRMGVARVRPLSGGVSFGSGLEDAYRVLLWSRVASRVLLALARVDASDADALYEGVYRIPWKEHLVAGKTVAVSAHGTSATLRDTRFTALRVKDAIVDRMRDETGTRPDVDTRNPDLLVNVNLHRDRATVSLDLSGSSLENRGCRVAARPHGAPIRENLAAALLLAAGWGKPSLRDALLVNPFCASGTIAIEAALIAGDIAPGIARGRWGHAGWAAHDEALWGSLVDEADERAETRAAERRGHRGGGRAARPQIVAADADPAALDYARSCARRAAVADAIEFAERGTGVPALADLPAHGGMVLACNVPTGAKFPRAQLPVLYSELAPLVVGADAAGVLCADPDIDAFLGRGATSSHAVRNGRDQASLRVYERLGEGRHSRSAGTAHEADGAVAPSAHTISVRDQRIAVNDAGAQQFASRLNKVAKERRKWAQKAKVQAYRVYDADLPDYNMAIDVYRGAGSCEGRTLVHVAEYAPPKQIDAAKAARRMADALRIVPVVLGVEPDEVYVKRRVRSKGGSQYAEAGDGVEGHTPRFITEEHGLRFEVDLGDYLDTGLFLDHRDTRALIGVLAKGKSFLNLFAYTGTASVYAAAGGAKFTTTVDISNTYQEWARRNFKLNKLLDRNQEFVRADVLSWASEMRHSRNRWDLVFCDPPTFSNSSKMGGRDWDVQRDHAELLIDVSRLLTRQGAAVFSCNLRKFKLDYETLAKAGVQAVDITAKTIPHDFERNPKVHHCFLLRRVA